MNDIKFDILLIYNVFNLIRFTYFLRWFLKIYNNLRGNLKS